MYNKSIKEYYERYPDIALEHFHGIKLKWYQKIRLRMMSKLWK